MIVAHFRPGRHVTISPETSARADHLYPIVVRRGLTTFSFFLATRFLRDFPVTLVRPTRTFRRLSLPHRTPHDNCVHLDIDNRVRTAACEPSRRRNSTRRSQCSPLRSVPKTSKTEGVIFAHIFHATHAGHLLTRSYKLDVCVCVYQYNVLHVNLT